MRIGRFACALLASAILAVGAVSAAPSETPKHFIARLFALYATNSPWWTAGPGSAAGKRLQAEFYDPMFTRLMDDNSTLAAKSGDADLDYDPVCQCQDSGAVYHYLSGAPAGGALFNAKVDDNGTAPWTIVLTSASGSWRVYDVIDSTGSIRARLTRHNACMRTSKSDAALTACEGGH
jgi:hypothetical protein